MASSETFAILLAKPDFPADFASLLADLHARKYTGPLTLHFKDGRPQLAELPAPKIRLTTT